MKIKNFGPKAFDIFYTKWNPSGNTTLFLQGKPESTALRINLAKQALTQKALAAEQVGFIWDNNLQMAGDEFCLNATAALAANLYLESQKINLAQEFVLNVSGWPSPILASAQGNDPQKTQVKLKLTLPKFSLESIANNIFLVKFEGISHFLISANCYRQEAQNTLTKLIAWAHLESEPCVGAIWWEEIGPNCFKITPLVWVKDVATCVFETACGSGSLALALKMSKTQNLNNQEISLVQPSGATISCQVKEENVCVKSQVDFLAQGQVSLTV
ncbi:MAG: hypothetical protein IJT59_01375 [Desulfovibrionaceae bacterium]|nr:hypothetical protein [Desulfovibrionaceae bacterium]